ncbi:MAG: response regulator [Actinobacteria bacterium 13_2_20CM_2_71_6]|nr:MAG: response regulator [Actinobacteria bacterium 13_2_20CM_2_71_6]
MAGVIDIAVVDDDRMLRDGLDRWLADVTDLRLVAATATVNELLAIGDVGGDADVVLLDLMLRDGSDPTCNVRRLGERGCRVLVISVWAPPPQVAAGARGYVTKDNDLDSLAESVREVCAGGVAYSPELAMACLRDARPERPRLAPKERAVLLAYASGMTLKSAARHLGIQPETAKTYLERVKVKYHATGRPTYTKIDLAKRVREDGLDLLPPELGT